MTVSFVRTTLLYIIVVIALRIMGKRQIGELSPTEFVITILVSELASIPLQSTDIPLVYGIMPILTLLSLEIITSALFMRSRWFRKIAVGRTSILIENGIINQKEMKRIRLTLDELLEELRLKSYIDIGQVKYAILESNGELSVFPFSTDSPATRKDINLYDDIMHLPHTIISDGTIIKSEAIKLGINEKQIHNELSKHGLTSYDQVFLMQMDEGGNVIIIPKEETT